jgi:transposase
MTLRSHDGGALPITNFLETMWLQSLLKRCLLPTDRALLVLLRNILMAREPSYGVGQWAHRCAPDWLVLWSEELEQINDDRLGRCLDRLFDALRDGLMMTVLHQVIDEFQVSLDELHNDSTTVSFYGAYEEAEEVGQGRSRPTLAMSLGHSKDHPPHSKQLLDMLTVTEHGGVPIYFTSANGNTTDDTPGRPSKHTKFVKKVKRRFDITWSVDMLRLSDEHALDGIFLLISNVTDMTAEQPPRAYKRQPIIEKRFSQMKTDFSVAPVYLKSVNRIQALLAVYFSVLIVQTRRDRDLRLAMHRADVTSLP